jgi:hypothetical protein
MITTIFATVMASKILKFFCLALLANLVCLIFIPKWRHVFALILFLGGAVTIITYCALQLL